MDSGFVPCLDHRGCAPATERPSFCIVTELAHRRDDEGHEWNTPSQRSIWRCKYLAIQAPKFAHKGPHVFQYIARELGDQSTEDDGASDGAVAKFPKPSPVSSSSVG